MSRQWYRRMKGCRTEIREDECGRKRESWSAIVPGIDSDLTEAQTYTDSALEVE